MGDIYKLFSHCSMVRCRVCRLNTHEHLVIAYQTNTGIIFEMEFMALLGHGICIQPRALVLLDFIGLVLSSRISRGPVDYIWLHCKGTCAES